MIKKDNLKIIIIILLSQIIIIGCGFAIKGIVKSTSQTSLNSSDKQAVKNNTADNQKKKDVKSEYLTLAQYVTESESDDNRNKNLALACEKIDGKEIAPGEVISYNKLVGLDSSQTGYVEAPVIVNGGEITTAVGGGVCQVATALYNCALLSNFKIVERHKHSFSVNYVQVGLDATVSYPETDLQIQNTLDQSVIIKAVAKEGKVTIQFMAKESLPYKVEINSVVEREIDPEGEEIRLNTALNFGERKTIREARKGYITNVVRNIIQNGEIISSETISHDNYPAINAIIEEGSNNSK